MAAAMTFDQFVASLRTRTKPPGGLSAPLRALWIEAKGDWALAHSTVDSLETKEAARVHAYLHRREGDRDNARYWYGRAGAAPFREALELEWELVARALLGDERPAKRPG
jgi:hypothetical protein